MVDVPRLDHLLESQKDCPGNMQMNTIYPSSKFLWSCTHVKSCQNYKLYINLHIILNIVSKETSNIQESMKFIKSLKR